MTVRPQSVVSAVATRARRPEGTLPLWERIIDRDAASGSIESTGLLPRGNGLKRTTMRASTLRVAGGVRVYTVAIRAALGMRETRRDVEVPIDYRENLRLTEHLGALSGGG